MYRLLNKAITEFHCYTLCSRCFSWHELHPWGFGSFSVSCCVQQTHLQGRERTGHLCTRIIWVAALWHLVVQGHWRAGLCQNATRNIQNGINNRFAAAQATGLLPAVATPQSVLSPSRGASKEQTTIRFLQLWVTQRSDKTQPTKRNRAPSHPVRRFYHQHHLMSQPFPVTYSVLKVLMSWGWHRGACSHKAHGEKGDGCCFCRMVESL